MELDLSHVKVHKTARMEDYMPQILKPLINFVVHEMQLFPSFTFYFFFSVSNRS